MKKKILIIALIVIFFGLFRTFVYQIERETLFQAESTWLPGFSDEIRSFGIEELYIDLGNGKRMNALFQDKQSNEVFIFCHGNAGNMSYNSGNIANLESSGRSYLMFDYPGYGKSEGIANEDTLFESGQAAYDFLVKKKGILPEKIIPSGQSLGASVCLNIAAKNPVRSVIAESGFISIKEVAKDLVGNGVALFVSNSFQNLELLKEITEPILFIHGDADKTLNIRHSEKMYQEANEPKFIEYLEGHDHNQFILDANSRLSERLEIFYKDSLFPTE